MVDADRSVPVRRRLRQERPDPALRLASRRDGGPHAGLGPDPRGHHGDRRRLHGGALSRRCTRWRPKRCSPSRSVGALTALLRRDDRPGSERHQARPGLLHGQPARLHVPGVWRRRLHGRHLPPDDPRVLQGLLFLGSGSVMHGMRTGEQDMTEDGWLEEDMPVDAQDDARRLHHRHRRDSRRWPVSSPRTRSSGHLQDRGRGQFAVGAVGFAAPAMTAFYMFRLYFMTFRGEFRGTEEQARPISTRAPTSMVLPLHGARGWGRVRRSLPACRPRWAAAIAIEHSSTRSSLTRSSSWRRCLHRPSRRRRERVDGGSASIRPSRSPGSCLRGAMYQQQPAMAERWSRAAGPWLIGGCYDKYYVDEAYGKIFVRGLALGAARPRSTPCDRCDRRR